MEPISPWLRWPLTDLFGAMLSHQWGGPCQDMEMKFVECLEAYGLERGLQKCDVIFQDFKECHYRAKQTNRTLAMRWERDRQYWSGERTKENRYAPGPRPDSI